MHVSDVASAPPDNAGTLELGEKMKKSIQIISIMILTSLFVNTSYSQEAIEAKKYPSFILNQKDPGKKVQVELAANSVSLSMSILPYFSKVLNFKYNIENEYDYNTISVYIKGNYTKKEMWDMFVNILMSCSASYTIKEDSITISPTKKTADISESEKAKKLEEFKKIREKILKKMQEERKNNSNK